jgi:hypothetical protein
MFRYNCHASVASGGHNMTTLCAIRRHISLACVVSSVKRNGQGKRQFSVARYHYNIRQEGVNKDTKNDGPSSNGIRTEYLRMQATFTAFLPSLSAQSRGISVSMVTRLGLDDRCSIPGRGWDCSPSHHVQSSSRVHPASHPMGTGA